MYWSDYLHMTEGLWLVIWLHSQIYKLLYQSLVSEDFIAKLSPSFKSSLAGRLS